MVGDLDIYRGVTSLSVADNTYPHSLGTLHAIYRQFLANAWAYTFNNLLNLFIYVCIFVYMYVLLSFFMPSPYRMNVYTEKIDFPL